MNETILTSTPNATEKILSAFVFVLVSAIALAFVVIGIQALPYLLGLWS